MSLGEVTFLVAVVFGRRRIPLTVDVYISCQFPPFRLCTELLSKLLRSSANALLLFCCPDWKELAEVSLHRRIARSMAREFANCASENSGDVDVRIVSCIALVQFARTSKAENATPLSCTTFALTFERLSVGKKSDLIVWRP